MLQHWVVRESILKFHALSVCWSAASMFLASFFDKTACINNLCLLLCCSLGETFVKSSCFFFKLFLYFLQLQSYVLEAFTLKRQNTKIDQQITKKYNNSKTLQ